MTRSVAIALACSELAVVTRPAEAQITPGSLSSAHSSLDGSGSCLDCHSSARGVDAALCIGCHAELGDRIRERRGLHARAEYERCERCHIEHQGRDFELVYWGERGETSFDHELAGFPLAGAHRPLGCTSCHAAEKLRDGARLRERGANPERTYLGLASTCAPCHADEHRGQFGAQPCSDCHGVDRFAPTSGFEHARSAFPLTGMHQRVECDACHRTGGGKAPGAAGKAIFAQYRGASATCASCHADPHQRKFGLRCESCHGTEGWKRVDIAGFDHGKTRYPLRGRHARVACADCHKEGLSAKIHGFESCASCHADEHAGQFAAREGGNRCDDCHSTNAFVPSTFELARHEMSRFPLDGAHRKVECRECHSESELPSPVEASASSVGRSIRTRSFRFPSLDCVACHADPHSVPRLGGMDVGCADCHRIEKWSVPRFDHGRTLFALDGAHGKAPCVACHLPKTVQAAQARPAKRGQRGIEVSFAGLSVDCASCHRDPHLGQFLSRTADRSESGASCTDCHDTLVWRSPRFDHDRDSSFALEGGHRAVPCVGCHPAESIQGETFVRYRPLDSRCAACHGASTGLRGVS